MARKLQIYLCDWVAAELLLSPAEAGMSSYFRVVYLPGVGGWGHTRSMDVILAAQKVLQGNIEREHFCHDHTPVFPNHCESVPWDDKSEAT